MYGNISVIVSLVVTAGLFAAAKLVSPANTFWQLLAQVTGILGIILLSWSYIISSKNRVIEKLFGGLDKAYRLHHIIGGTAFVLVLNHPLFLVIKSLPVNTLKTYLLPSSVLSYTLGVLGLYALLILLVLTLYVDLPYYLWKKTHEWMGIVILLSGLHALLVPSDVSSFLPLTIWVGGWIAIALLAFIYKRYLYYALQPKNNYRMRRIVQEGDVWIAELEPSAPRNKIEFAPGQYAFFEVNRPGGRKRDEHPFSILSTDGDILTIAAKIIGEFTAQMLRNETGTLVTVRGPYGNFGLQTRNKKRMVWIAGGIGITPFATMARAILKDQEVYLYYSCRDDGRGILGRIFQYLSINKPNLHWIPCNSKTQGRITGKMLFDQGLTTPDTFFFFCGPDNMMKSLENQLIKLGIKRRHIIYENFAFK